MPGRSCYFFADERDLSELLKDFRELGDYKYVQIRSDINEPNLVLLDPVELLPLAMVTPEKSSRAQSFLVVEQDQEVFEREIAMKDGSGARRIADQNNNFDSIVLAFGGDAGDRTLILSDINTVGDTAKAVEMHKKFKKLVAARAKKVGRKGSPSFLMPGAIEKLKSGWRLAGGKEWSRETDPEILPEEIAAL